MTTGSTHNYVDSSNYNSREWSGGDGKYLVAFPSGRKLMKWNNYACTSHIGTGSKDSTYNRYYNACSATVNAPWRTFDSGWDTNLDFKLIGKLTEKANSTTFNAGMALGQINQTTALLIKTGTKFVKALLALKRGDFLAALSALGLRPSDLRISNMRNLLGDLSALWLELEYGWKPLISDIHSAVQQVVQANTNYVPPWYVRSRYATIGNFDGSLLSLLGGSAPGTCRSQRTIVMALTGLTDAYDANGLTDPATVAWDLTPWSFVFDWFMPFGNFLAAVHSARTLKGRYLYTDVFKSECTSVPMPLGGYYDGSICSDTFISINRYASNSLDVPLPAFNRPENIMSPERFTSAVSLFIQQVQRGR